MATALIGRRVGDEVQVRRPAGRDLTPRSPGWSFAEACASAPIRAIFGAC